MPSPGPASAEFLDVSHSRATSCPPRVFLKPRVNCLPSVEQAFRGRDTDPTCTWVIDYLMRNLPPWEDAQLGKGHRRGSHGQRRGSGDSGNGSAGEGGDDGGADGPSGSGGGNKRQRKLPRTKHLRDDSSASERRSLRSGKALPSRRVMALPCGCTTSEHSDCRECPAGMPPPRELDYEGDLPSGGFLLGWSHYNSPVFATRCESGSGLCCGAEVARTNVILRTPMDTLQTGCSVCRRPGRMHMLSMSISVQIDAANSTS